ncbi:MAG: hypothetical protein KME28_24725 [Pelatocladus maniniholoensis HA4357-MV3]|jgi:hypothetical protein|uniref:Uncharacterized protein n=1 Tax=Pelatocladus maniniholoensis HA4357-MV3 TaxID=1117104 RepID=A0A9E3HDQ5_9NOST|nr:hypothetical protein [Pelatocladus maniniholoensis HA4357-MV3]BAZ67846.1 hypothetical protein NIES4106_26030 [Fischerella sp. NIES-4106]
MISTLIAGLSLLILSGIAESFMSYMLFTKISNYPEDKIIQSVNSEQLLKRATDN